MFVKKFKIVEVRDNGVTVTHYLQGTRRAVKKDIEMMKKNSKRYEVFGKEGLIVWA